MATLRIVALAVLLVVALMTVDWLLRGAVSAPTDLVMPQPAPDAARPEPSQPAPPPEEPPAKLALAEVRASATAGDYMSALRQLYDLHYAVQDEVPGSLIAEWIRRTVDTYDTQLATAGHSEQRMALHDFLILKEPGNVGYFYRRAQLQAELGLYWDALASLDMVIYDAVLGERGAALARQLRERVDPPPAPPERPPPPPERAAPRANVVALRRLGGHFVVAALLDERHALNLIIDTGASASALTEAAARRTGLDLTGATWQRFSTAGGPVIAQVVAGRKVSVAGAAIAELSIGVLPLQAAAPVDGLLGMDYLRHFEFVIDQQRAELRLSPR